MSVLTVVVVPISVFLFIVLGIVAAAVIVVTAVPARDRSALGDHRNQVSPAADSTYRPG